MSGSDLIVIDMQMGSFTDAMPRHEADGSVDRLNRLAAQSRWNEDHVIFIRHDGLDGDTHYPSQPGWYSRPDLAVYAYDRIIVKTTCDSFLETELAGALATSAL